MKSEIAKAVQEQVFEFNDLVKELQEQKQQHARNKTIEDKRYAQERLKQLQPSKPREPKKAWRESTNHNYSFENEYRRLQGRHLSDNEIHRIHILPRSYKQKFVEGVHSGQFKMTSNETKEFPEAGLELSTVIGKQRLNRNIETFENFVNTKKEERQNFYDNRRTIFQERNPPRWAPSSNHGKTFEDFRSDPNNLFMKSLLPLDKKPLQDGAFRRTMVYTRPFREEQGSII